MLPKSDYILFIQSHLPHSTSASVDTLEAVLAASNLGLDIALVFVGDGVYQLSDEQNAKAISRKDLKKQLGLLPLYDIEQIYAEDNEVLKSINTDNMKNKLGFKPIPRMDLQLLCRNATNILSF